MIKETIILGLLSIGERLFQRADEKRRLKEAQSAIINNTLSIELLEIGLDYSKWKDKVIETVHEYDNQEGDKIEQEFVKYEENYDNKILSRIMDTLDSINEKLQKDIDISIENNNSKNKGDYSKVFIVNGRNEFYISQTEAFLRRIGLKPIILREQANLGQTIIEKLESNTDVSFAIVLYTSCDKDYDNKKDALSKSRTHQNVAFEHGYFNAKLGRNRVCALVEEGVEIPSDLAGVVYITIDKNGAWKTIVAKEMKIAGLNVDMNNL